MPFAENLFHLSLVLSEKIGYQALVQVLFEAATRGVEMTACEDAQQKLLLDKGEAFTRADL